MAVLHKLKKKVRPVLNFRELNGFVSCSGVEADSCEQKMREWRKKPGTCALLDLQDAYMQIVVHPECHRYQRVVYQGRTYLKGRMGFGLNIAPKFCRPS